MRVNHGPRRTRALLLEVAALVAALAAGTPARGDWSFQAESSFNASELETRAIGSEPTQSDGSAVTQRYRLTLDRRFWPYLALSGTGQWQQTLGWTDTGGETARADNRRWNGVGTLSFGPPILSGQASYEHREQSARARAGNRAWVSSPTLISESAYASLGWRPAGGPTLDLRVSTLDDHDSERALADRISRSASLAARYAEIRDLDLRGSVTYSTSSDDLRGTDTEDWQESFSALWNGAWLRRRLTANASYTVARRDSTLTATKPDAEFVTLQLPAEGRSRICSARPCPLPTLGELLANPALVDGNVEVGAGVDLGHAVTPSDLTREIGVRFLDPTTEVNRVYVYVDRPVPASLATALAWTVYRSDDGVNWFPASTPISAGVTFGLFENRFEIPIPLLAARWVKLVVTPLVINTEPTLAQLLVTELQFFVARPAAEVVGSSSDTTGALTAAMRYRIEEHYNTAYDFAFFVSHGRTSNWSVLNGLSAGRALGRTSSWNARLDRNDSGGGGGTTSQTRLSATVTSDPLPTLGGSLTASGGVSEDQSGSGWATSLSALGRADVYTGISLGVLGTGGVGQTSEGIDSQSAAASLNVAIVPHRTTTLNGGVGLSRSKFGDLPWDRRSRVDGSFSFSPFPALALSGGVSHTVENGVPATLASFSVSASPFRGGDLALSFGYNETLDTAWDQRTRQWGPGLRWKIRPGTNFTVSYSNEQTRAPAVDTDTQSLFGNLIITLR